MIAREPVLSSASRRELIVDRPTAASPSPGPPEAPRSPGHTAAGSPQQGARTVSTPTIDTTTGPAAPAAGPDAEFDLDIRIFESGVGLDEIIRLTDDGCGSTCQSAYNSC
jgi:FxLD family lantipeptide